MGKKYEAVQETKFNKAVHNLLESCEGGGYSSNAHCFMMEAYRKNESDVVAAASRVSSFKDAIFERVNAGMATEDGGRYLGGNVKMKTNQLAKKINTNVIRPATGL